MADDRQPKLLLAAFGKHPGWDDHIDDIGLTTGELAEVKRRLYTIGVRENLDRGEWDQLPPEGKLEGFKHVFIWSVGRSILVGRLWSSRDGKGRGRYPMVVCAESSTLPLPWVLEQVLPRLKEIEKACTSTTSREDVKAVMEQHQKALTSLLANIPAAGSFAASPGALAALADKPPMGPDHQGLHRLLYQIERSWAEYCVGGLTKGDEPSTWSMTLAASVLRVPACDEDAGQVLKLWFEFLATTLSPGVPAVVLYREGQPYADLMAGQPSAQEFRALCATPAALPLVTDIPYTIDADFIAAAAAAIEASRRGEVALPVPQPAGGNGGNGPGAIKSLLGRIMSFGRRKMMLLLLLGAVALVAAGVAYVAIHADTIFPPTQPRPAPADRLFTDEEAGRWRQLCDDYFQWFGILDSRLDEHRAALEADPHLAAILALLEKAHRDGVPLNPRHIGDAEGDTISHLTAEPPPRARTDQGVRETQQALDVIQQVRAALTSWPRFVELQQWAKVFDERGWAGRAAYLRSVDPLAITIQSGLPAALAQVTARHEAAKPFAEPAQQLTKLQGDIEKAGAGTLFAVFARRVAADLAPPPDKPEAPADWPRLAERAARLLEVGERAAAFLKGPWADQVDREQALKDPALPVVKPDEAPTIGQMELFLREAGGYRRLVKDPRPPRDQWKARFEPIDRRLSDTQSPPPGLADKKQQRDELLVAVDKLYLLPALVRHETAIKAAHADCDRRLIELSGVVLGDAKKWLEEVRKPLGLASRAIEDFSQRQVAGLIGTQTPADLERDYARWHQLRESIESTRKLLKAMDQELAAAAKPPDTAPRWAAELAETCVARREKAAKAAVAVVEQGYLEKLTGDAILARWRPDAARHKTWQAEAARVIASLGEIEAALDTAGGLDDLSGERKLRDQVASVRALPALADLRIDAAEAVAVVMDRVAALEAMEKAADAAAILKMTDEAGKGRPELLLAGWRALGKLKPAPWPASLEQWSRDRSLAKQLMEAAKTLPEARQTLVRDELKDGARRRWMVCFEQLEKTDDIGKAGDEAAALGITLDDLTTPRCRFNLLLHRFRMQTRPKEEAKLREQLADFHADLTQRFSDPAADLGIAPFLTALKALTVEDNARPAQEVERAGPGAPGTPGTPGAPGAPANPWQAKLLAEDGSRVQFSRGDVKLTFVLIDTDKAEPAFYLLDSEVSVAAFIEAMGERATELKDARQIAESAADLRGPGVWTWHRDGKRLVPSRRWLPAGFSYAPGLKVTEPTADHPMQHVAPAAALLAARQLGCRLPTAAQWRIAQDKFAPAQPRPNLRDATWLAQWRHVNELPKDKPVRWPDDGAFWPRGAGATRAEADRAAPPADPAIDDGQLFFQEVAAPGDVAVRHLIGNVAEYVYDEPEKADAAKTVQECVSLVTDNDRFRVIGGSALSAPTIKTDEPQPIDWVAAARGFSDVGFRLAFPAPRVPLAKQLDRVLEAQAYLVKRSP